MLTFEQWLEIVFQIQPRETEILNKEILKKGGVPSLVPYCKGETFGMICEF